MIFDALCYASTIKITRYKWRVIFLAGLQNLLKRDVCHYCTRGTPKLLIILFTTDEQTLLRLSRAIALFLARDLRSIDQSYLSSRSR